MNRRVAQFFSAIAIATLASGALASPAFASAPAPAPLVVIDPGHGGPYSNANANGLREETVNLKVALALRDSLKARGYQVKMTRESDRAVTLSDIRTWNYSEWSESWAFATDGHRGLYGGIPKDDLQARSNVANTSGADLFISIHANGSVNRSARGTETYASRRDALGCQLAPIVHSEIVKRTHLYDRKWKTADFYVCRWSNMPSLLVETAFITNTRDASLLKQSSFRKKIAEGIATGVDRWMNTSARNKKIHPRIAGTSPTSLAQAVSRADFAGGAPVAVIARSDQATDVPGIAGLAAKLGGPVLWTKASGPSTSTATELALLAPDKIVLAGVDGSFDETAVALLAAASGVATSAVDILGGADRAALAVSIAESVGVPAGGSVLVVDTADTDSAMAAAPISAARGIPILMTTHGTLSPDASAWLALNRPALKRVVIAGAEKTVSASVAGDVPMVRLAGSNYSQTAGLLNARYFTSTTAGATRPVIATLRNRAEYLTAATHAGRKNQPLVPVYDRVIPALTREWLTNRRSAIGGFEILTGGGIPYLMDRMLVKADYI